MTHVCREFPTGLINDSDYKDTRDTRHDGTAPSALILTDRDGLTRGSYCTYRKSKNNLHLP